AHMWFLYALMCVQGVYYLAKCLLGKAGLMIVGVAWVLAYVIGKGHWIDVVAEGAAMGGAFFFLGMLVAGRINLPAASSRSGIIAVLAAAIWLGTYIVSTYVPSTVLLRSLVALCGIVMTLAVCFLLRNIRGRITTGLAQVGQASLAIYVAHTIFAAGVRILLYHGGVFNSTLHVVVGTSVGLLI